MNGRDRVTRILGGQTVDRKPVVPVLSLYGARLTAQEAGAYYTDPEAYVVGQGAVLDLFEPDVLFSPFALTVEGAAFGSQERFLPRHPPNMAAFAAHTRSEIEALPVPDVGTHPRLAYIREAVRLLRARYGDRAMICGICLSPIDSPALILGIDRWLEVFLGEPEIRQAVLAKTVPFFVAWANALLADGADFLVLPVAFCNPNVVTRELAQTLALPVLRDAFARVKGPLVFHHVGATLGPFLPLLAGLPNVMGFALDPRDDAAQARAAVGPDKFLLGKVDGPALAGVTAAEAGLLAREALRTSASDRLFFLATSSADVSWDTPPANLLALREAAEGEADASRRGGGGVTLLSCSIFRPVVESMDWEGLRPERIRYVDSALHVDPAELEAILTSLIDFERSLGRRVLVAYGDCEGRLVEQCRADGIRRIPAVNCCQALLGPERYREICRRGAFLFLPEWTLRWREVLEKAYGASGGDLREMFKASNREIVFLEAEGWQPLPGLRREIEEFFGLPSSSLVVTTTHFEEILREECRRVRGGALP